MAFGCCTQSGLSFLKDECYSGPCVRMRVCGGEWRSVAVCCPKLAKNLFLLLPHQNVQLLPGRVRVHVCVKRSHDLSSLFQMGLHLQVTSRMTSLHLRRPQCPVGWHWGHAVDIVNAAGAHLYGRRKNTLVQCY